MRDDNARRQPVVIDIREARVARLYRELVEARRELHAAERAPATSALRRLLLERSARLERLTAELAKHLDALDAVAATANQRDESAPPPVPR